MKLIIAIVHDEDAANLTRTLNKKGIMVTRLHSTGGFLRVGNTTLIIGIDESRLEEVKLIFESKCKARNKSIVEDTPYANMESFIRKPLEVKVGGATIFVVDVEEFIKI